MYLKYKDTPGCEKAAEEITLWNKAHINMMAEVGMMDAKTRNEIMAIYPHYIPLQRVADQLESRGIKGGFLDVSNPVSHLKGSGHQILDPLTSMMNQSVKFHAAAVKHRIANSILDMAESTPG